MFGVLIAVTILQEVATVQALAGAALVVCGIVMITWERSGNSGQVPWWYYLIPLAAALLAGIVHPMRRYALSLSNEPLFFAALVGVVSLVCFVLYLPFTRNALVWHRRAIGPFLAAGLFETLGIVLVIHALAAGSVVVVSPLVGISPLWALLGAVIFLRDLERINARTVLGTVCVVVGTAAISLDG
jgi:drug/metabolite transporter (DMT)-like permease